MRYSEKLAARIAATGSRLCVGLDPRFELMGDDPQGFLRRVVEETLPHAAAYKPNVAYFEALGSRGWRMLEELMEWRPREVPFILDAKRSDIGETQKAYARAVFDHLDADAVTLNAWLGADTLEPFLTRAGRGLYLLAVTSNPGAGEIALQRTADGRYLFEKIADMAERAAGREADVGLVAGLTNLSPEVLARVPDVPLLVPGLGAQGGEVAALQGGSRTAPTVVNVSRAILFSEPERSFAEKARHWAQVVGG